MARIKKLKGRFEILIPDYIDSKLIDRVFQDKRKEIYNIFQTGGLSGGIDTQEGKVVLEKTNSHFFEGMYKILCKYLEENHINCSSVVIGDKPDWYSPNIKCDIQIVDMNSELYPITWNFKGKSVISPHNTRQNKVLMQTGSRKLIKRKITEDDAERFVKGVWKNYKGPAALSGTLILDDWPDQYGNKIGHSETGVNKTAGPEDIAKYLNKEMKGTARRLRKSVLGR